MHFSFQRSFSFQLLVVSVKMFFFAAVPSQPSPPEPVDMDTTWVTLKWDPPERDGGSPILGYHVEFREPAGHKWILANPHMCKEPRFTVDSLRDRGEYEFRVVAKNAAGLSKPSLTSGIIKLQPKYGPPGAPSMPHAESIGRNHVTLTWSPPVTDGGSKITGYIVERRELGSGLWAKVGPVHF